MKSYMSASGIKKHVECPKRWWFHYESDYEPIEGETKYLDVGSAVHEALEDALHAYDDGGGFVSVADRQYEHYAEQFGVTDDMWETGQECVSRAVRFVADEEPELRGIEAEAEFRVSRPDLDERFTGSIDVATQSEIWDWKTGSIRENTALKERIQGAVYMGAYRNLYGEAPEKVRFIYLKEQKKREFDPTDEVWGTMLAKAKSLARDKRSGEFEATPGEPCYWCPYETYCSAAGGISGTFDWEDWTKL